MTDNIKIGQTLDFLKLKTDGFVPDVAIILGSGLSEFTNGIEGIKIKYSEIPNFGFSNVKGHKGELLFCNINGKNCAIMQGRFHFYEGNSLGECTYPVKILKLLGAKTLFITNAAGGINPEYNPGDIMLIKDHINLMGDNPLRGKNDDTLGDRFPDMSDIYNEDLRKLAFETANELNINLKEGIYLATMGPSYETKAEIRMFGILGADAIGMSSAPEAIVANYLKMNVIGFSLITNPAAGIKDVKLSHGEVLEIGKASGSKLCEIIKKMIEKI